jgi:phosphate transport system permease protein
MATAPASLEIPAGRSIGSRVHAGDAVAYSITLIAAGSILLITVMLVYNLWTGSELTRHKFGFEFIMTQVWDPVAEQYGSLPFIFGTVATAVLALLISVPLGVGAAIFLAELAPRRLSSSMTFLIELLAAVPSVIYGLLGIFLLVPAMQQYGIPALKSVLGSLPIFSGPFYGPSIFTASIVLSLMIVPFIVSVSREVLLVVPTDQREASLALGATTWETTWKVVVPYARRGIYGSIFLALARALGETMAVTMVIGNTAKIPSSLLAPGHTIAAVIANEFAEATSATYLSALTEMGLVLFALTIILNGFAQLLLLTTGSRVKA